MPPFQAKLSRNPPFQAFPSRSKTRTKPNSSPETKKQPKTSSPEKGEGVEEKAQQRSKPEVGKLATHYLLVATCTTRTGKANKQ
jgi:hypothetical protein